MNARIAKKIISNAIKTGIITHKSFDSACDYLEKLNSKGIISKIFAG